MQEEKDGIRRRLLRQRKALLPEAVRAASEAGAQRLPEVCDWAQVKTVHVYRVLSVLGEIDTSVVVDWLGEHQPQVVVTVGEASAAAAFPLGDFDVIFVPVVGFDRDGYRLGMGGGWYDRWLATQPHALKIGLAYAWAEVPHLPHETHDIPLDMIIC